MGLMKTVPLCGTRNKVARGHILELDILDLLREAAAEYGASLDPNFAPASEVVGLLQGAMREIERLRAKAGEE